MRGLDPLVRTADYRHLFSSSCLVLVFGDIAQVPHPHQNIIRPSFPSRFVPQIGRRRFRQRGQIGRLRDRKIICRDPEKCLCCLLHSVDRTAERNLVQIHFQDFVFGQLVFQTPGQYPLLDFATDCTVTGQKCVLDYLLGDSRSSSQTRVRIANFGDDRAKQGRWPYAVMIVKLVIFDCHDGFLHAVRDLLECHYRTFFILEYVVEQHFSRLVIQFGRLGDRPISELTDWRYFQCRHPDQERSRKYEKADQAHQHESMRPQPEMPSQRLRIFVW